MSDPFGIERLSLRLRILLFFLFLGAGGTAAILTGLWMGARRVDEAGVTGGFVTAAIVAVFGLLGLVVWIWVLFDQHVARAVLAIASEMRARAHAGVAHEIDPDVARYLGDLAPAAAAVTQDLGRTRTALEEAVARETERIAAERERLAAILRDVPAGVLLLSEERKVVLYNARAQGLLGGAHVLGLDRPLGAILRGAGIQSALDLLDAGAETAEALVTTVADGRLLNGQIRRLSEADWTGFVLTLTDITEDLAQSGAREQLLADVFEQVRRPAASLRATLDVLDDAGDLDADRRQAFQTALIAEADTLVDSLNELSTRADARAGAWWPRADIAGADLAGIVARRAAVEELPLTLPDSALPAVHCDGFAVALVLARVMRAAAERSATSFALDIEPEAAGALLSVSWDGAPLGVAELEACLAEPLGEVYGALTGRDLLRSHGTEIWPDVVGGEGRESIRLPLPSRTGAVAPLQSGSLPDFYDFSLLAQTVPPDRADTALDALTLVVFDTETTGLETRTDAIVQIAGVRIVNGRLLAGEVFDTLVDPERPIPPASTKVHGISDSMVAGSPHLAEAVQGFHGFASESVLVAHNAPFDMAFLRRDEAVTGARFTQPVLDTVLLSALAYGQLAEHTLDALADRLGVVIPAEVRHTALGDALATAKVFLALVAILREQGIVTLGQVLDACEAHGRLVQVERGSEESSPVSGS